MNLKQRVGAKIKQLRKEKKLSQEQLAEYIDRSVDAVSQIERGVSLPSAETLEKLSVHLFVPVSELFTYGDGQTDEYRAKLMEELLHTARFLRDEDLAIAVKQIKALDDRAWS